MNEERATAACRRPLFFSDPTPQESPASEPRRSCQPEQGTSEESNHPLSGAPAPAGSHGCTCCSAGFAEDSNHLAAPADAPGSGRHRAKALLLHPQRGVHAVEEVLRGHRQRQPRPLHASPSSPLRVAAPERGQARSFGRRQAPSPRMVPCGASLRKTKRCHIISYQIHLQPHSRTPALPHSRTPALPHSRTHALGTWHSALGTRHSALGTRHSALGTWH